VAIPLFIPAFLHFCANMAPNLRHETPALCRVSAPFAWNISDNLSHPSDQPPWLIGATLNIVVGLFKVRVRGVKVDGINFAWRRRPGEGVSHPGGAARQTGRRG
jgi:hypothetical protein